MTDPEQPALPARLPAPEGVARTDRAVAVDLSPSRTGPGDSFWLQAPVAFVAPFLGRGWVLLLASLGMGAAVGLVAVIPGFLFKLGILLATQLVAVGVFVETFNRLAQAAMYRDDEQWLPEPHSELPSLSVLFFRGLIMSLLLALLGAVPLIVLFQTESLGLTFLAELAIFLYWPMALTVQSVSGRLLGGIDVVSVFRAVMIAPLEYVASCILTIGAMTLSVLGAGTVIGAGALAAAASGGSLGVGIAVYFLVMGALYAAVAYLHGVLGYLMGSLIRSKGDAFAFLSEG